MEVVEAGSILKNVDETIAARFQALFTLRNIIQTDSIDIIGEVLLDDDSDLLKHECAYCLGQMKHSYAIPYLLKCLEDEKVHPMVRHEAGEALGAIGSTDEHDILDTLNKYVNHSVRELAETCSLALDRLKWYNKKTSATANGTDESQSPYNTVDPTPSYPSSMTVDELKAIYLDKERSLFDRYRALFTLRNIGNAEAVSAICRGFFLGEDDSALFKHEVAFVLGQMQNKLSVEALEKTLANVNENEMVRHECAEALGSIGESEIIRHYLGDKSRIVSESCHVALDMANDT